MVLGDLSSFSDKSGDYMPPDIPIPRCSLGQPPYPKIVDGHVDVAIEMPGARYWCENTTNTDRSSEIKGKP
jgi:hypothetical protein